MKWNGGRLQNLDLLRGVAAVAVVAGHLRAFLFVDFSQTSAPTVLDRLFYLSTGLGHQAVVVFFVLSGYLVGGSVLSAHLSGCYSWKAYAIRRLSRLWVVLLPTLFLTLLLDSIGSRWAPDPYSGSLGKLYSSGPTPSEPADLRPSTFAGNAIFLQTIRVGCYGTNGPLWSLAYEFWYYLLFPLLAGTFLRPSASGRLIHGALLLLIVWWLPTPVIAGAGIWLLGVVAYWAGRSDRIARVCAHPLLFGAAGVTAIGAVVASKSTTQFGSDAVIGMSFAWLLIGLAGRPPSTGWLRRVGTGLSEVSYTLYAVHFPILALLFFVWLGPQQFQPGLYAYLSFACLLVGTLAVAWALWCCFERNTDRVRRGVEARFGT